MLSAALLIAGCDCGNQPPAVPDAGTGGGSAEDGGATGGGGGGGAMGGGGGGGGGAMGGGAGGGGVLPDGGSITLLAIGVTPASPRLAITTALQLTATGTFSDGSTEDVSAQVAWSSSAPTVAAVSPTGNASGLTAGMTTITATLSGISGSVGLTVTAATLASIAVTPASPSIAAGTTQQFVATGTFSDSSTQDLSTQVIWASSAPTTASISASGLASALAVGTTTISATLGAVMGSTALVVTGATLSSIAVTPVGVTIAKGTSQQFAATGTFSDGSTQDLTALATWSSTDAAVASMSSAAGSEGLATGVGVGTATIMATHMSVSGGTALNVSAAVLTAVSVTPSTPTIPLGTTQQFTATGIFSDSTTQDLTAQVVWSSSTPATASISNAAGSEGLATAAAVGSTTITATSGSLSGATALTISNATLQSISVTPPSPSRAKGLTVQFAATGQYSDQSTLDLTNQVTWSSTSTAVASISNAAGSEGLATAVAAGSSSIRATLGGTVGSTTLTVSNATLTSVAVTPATGSLPVGATLQLMAQGTFTDGSRQDVTTQAIWTSSATNIATVGDTSSDKGRAAGVAAGSATVTATVQAWSGTATLSVSGATLQSIAVTPANASLAKGTSRGFTATGTYSDNTTQDLTAQATWNSSATNVATVSNAAADRGLVSAVNPGTSTVTAAFAGRSGATQATVTNATLQSIAVTPANPSVANGKTQQFTATGTFSDGSTQTLTAQVTWSSSNTTNVTISNAAGSEGIATAMNQTILAVTITAAFGAVSGTASMTVTAATVESLLISPDPATVPVNDTRQLTATALYSDGTSQNVSNANGVSWTSSNTGVATVANPSGFPRSGGGVVTGVAVGMATITVTFGGKTDTVQLTANTATLQSITVTPANSSLPRSFGRQFRATGNYTDGSTGDLTGSVTWTSGNTNVATVNGSGFVTATATPGVSTITASTTGTPSMSGNTSLTVTNSTPSSLDVTPPSLTVRRQETGQLTAIATFSDGSTLDVTTQVNWASSAQFTAFVNGSGLVTGGFQTGNATVTATMPNTMPAVTDTSAITVVP
ncbi:MAG: Ig-like domain-containing protein [Archangium sp.]|nr:Ig-like domain-containing protein [Archangium sp.]